MDSSCGTPPLLLPLDFAKERNDDAIVVREGNLSLSSDE